MELLFNNLEKLLNATNGIEKARQLIFQLALQGKLTEQDPDDEPASELLKKIKKEKEKLIAEGKIRKQNDILSITEDEIPFKLPKDWKWVRLGFLGEIYNGNSINKQKKSSEYSDLNDGYDYIATKDVNFKNEKLNYDNGIRIPFDEPKFKIARKGSVLICSEGGSAGRKIGIVEKDICFGNKLYAIKPYLTLEQKYIYSVYRSSFFFQQISSQMTGIIGGISLNNFKTLLFPLPPLNEQKRIVEKVNSLIALLDEIEEKRERRNQKRIRLNNSSLDKLLTSKDDKELKTNWKRIEENFSTLYSVPENVTKLKQAILQFAVQGKLVKQDPNDEPASELLKKIKKEKEKLIAEGKIKKPKELPPIKDEEKPFELPKGWEWVRWYDVLSNNKYSMKRGPFGSALRKDIFVESGITVYEQYNAIHDDPYKFRYYITEKKYKELEAFTVQPGDFIISCSGVTLGRISLLPNDATFGIINQALLKLSINETLLDKKYFLMFFRSPYIQSIIFTKSLGSAIPNMVGVSELKKIVFPLPPLKEQKRIVEKVNKLMSLCITLEEKLKKKEEKAEKLVGAVVNNITIN